MNKTAISNLFRIDSISLTEMLQRAKSAGSYNQAIIRYISQAQMMSDMRASGLIDIAESAYALRNQDALEVIGKVLTHLPMTWRHRGAGDYYVGLSEKKKGNLDVALDIFKRIAGSAGPLYTAKALCSAGAILFEKSDISNSLWYRMQAIRVAKDYGESSVVAECLRAVAILKSIAGEHRHALADLDKALPFVISLAKENPFLYYDFQNSFAVELAELGRFKEAAHVSSIALASPFAVSYPEWRETRAEILIEEQRSSRSIVAVIGLPAADKVVHPDFSQADRFPYTASGKDRAGVVDFEARKTEMAKEQKKSNEVELQPDNQEFRQLSHDEKENRLAREIFKGDLLDEELNQLMDEVRRFRKTRQQKTKEE